ncbi:MAG: hypothetical protein WCW13_05140 [archaeon]|jgi:hypothetical protein
MTFNNSVLLIVKQSPGIDYNDLLTRIAPRYKNPASAKSALARSLKDLVSFGLMKKEGTKFFITDKGFSSMNIEMKDKLVLRLNEEMKHPLTNLEEILRFLVILSQRGNQDKDLLNNAKENASFTIKDIHELQSKIRAQRKHLKKMALLLEQQSLKLKELDFNDSCEYTFDDFFVSRVNLYSKNQKVIVETKDSDVLAKIPEHWKKQAIISVEGENIYLLLQVLASVPSAKAILYLQGLKIILMAGKANCFASHRTLNVFSETKLVDVVKEEQKNISQN